MDSLEAVERLRGNSIQRAEIMIEAKPALRSDIEGIF
jgi:hypothetical protein